MPVEAKTYELKSGKSVTKYYAYINKTIENKRRKIPIGGGFTRRSDAEKHLIEYARRNIKSSKIYFSDLLDEFLEYYKSMMPHDVRPRTYEAFINNIKQAQTFFNSYDVRQISAREIDAYRASLVSSTFRRGLKIKKYSSRTINIKMIELKKLLDYANRLGYCESPRMPRRLREEEREVKRLSIDQLIHLIECSDPYEEIFIGLCGLVGLRPEEARVLQVNHIDFKDRTINIISKRYNKKGRIVPISDLLHEILMKHRSLLDPPVTYIFPFHASKDGMRSRMKKVARRADIKFTATMLRKSFISLTLERGMDLILVQKIVGHMDPKTTSKHYVKISTEVLANQLRLNSLVQ